MYNSVTKSQILKHAKLLLIIFYHLSYKHYGIDLLFGEVLPRSGQVRRQVGLGGPQFLDESEHAHQARDLLPRPRGHCLVGC